MPIPAVSQRAVADAAKSGIAADKSRLVDPSIRAGAGAQRAVFTRCRLGRYAAVMLHDENDDGRLDENEMGLKQRGQRISRHPILCRRP
jgi:uncharacterized protein (DUF2141 family)